MRFCFYGKNKICAYPIEQCSWFKCHCCTKYNIKKGVIEK